jgi:hypothetical protein
VADFIVDHGVNVNDVCSIPVSPWKLFFDGSMGQYVLEAAVLGACWSGQMGQCM